jgi:hypothetical protein
MQMNGEQGDPQNLSVSVDWAVLREQRKMKIKEFKNEAINLANVKPVLKQRSKLVGDHKPDGLIKQKTITANFKEDETLNEFPDTRSIADDENSYVFQKYSQSLNPKAAMKFMQNR